MKKLFENMTEQELSTVLSECAKAVTSVLRSYVALPPGVTRHQFVLVAFDDPKVAQYASSCTRESMIEVMRETADRLERKQDVPR